MRLSVFLLKLTRHIFKISLKRLEIGYRLNDFQNPDIIENVSTHFRYSILLELSYHIKRYKTLFFSHLEVTPYK